MDYGHKYRASLPRRENLLSTGEAARLATGFVIPANGRTCPELAEGDLQCSGNAASPRAITPPKLACRWIKFNFVGGIGIGVQLTALWALTHAVRCNYLIATALAVETTVLHNFLWHQRFTWADRMRNHWRDSLIRLLQFNLTNGLVSILGNMILMRALVGGLHARVLIANMLSIATCSAANFALSELYVFRAKAISPRRHRDTEKNRGTAQN
jgi:putative flippase GtrA